MTFDPKTSRQDIWTWHWVNQWSDCVSNYFLQSRHINCSGYRGLQQDTDVISECTSACHLTLNPLKCKYLITSRKRQLHLPPGGLLLGSCTMEQVDSYRYLGVLVTFMLIWKDHIQHIYAPKPGNLLDCYTDNSPLGLTPKLWDVLTGS